MANEELEAIKAIVQVKRNYLQHRVDRMTAEDTSKAAAIAKINAYTEVLNLIDDMQGTFL